VYQFVCDRNLCMMPAKRTTCARQNTLDWIVLDAPSYQYDFTADVTGIGDRSVHKISVQQF